MQAAQETAVQVRAAPASGRRLRGAVRNLLHALLAGMLLLAAGNAVAKEFVFKDMQGHAQRLSDYRGKWVLVNFWATWCPPCLQEIPDLISLHDAHKGKDLVVIGVALDSTKEAVQRFVAQHGVTYPVVVGNYELAEQIGEVEMLPTSYLFDPSGKVAVAHTGIVTQAGLEEFIRSRSRK